MNHLLSFLPLSYIYYPDLVALWHIWDPKLIELGIIPNQEVAKEMYRQEIRNALLIQLRRVNEDQLEEDHMKNRQMNAMYVS